MSVDTIASPMIVIDTESYSGNFEHEMAVYLTGQFGASRIDQADRDLYAKDIIHLDWWDAHTVSQDNDRGYPTPVTIFPTPGWFNNGHGGHFRDIPENHEIARQVAIDSAREYKAPHIKAAQDRLDAGDFEDKPNGWTKEGCERTIEAARQFIAAAGSHRFPAYQSVAIFVDEMPPREVLEEMFERATAFGEIVYPISMAPYGRQTIKVTGFRFIDFQANEQVLDTEPVTNKP